ncbi:MAG: hypothetical protein JSS66_03820 [Armatimonadetes bacterium]|nr:hypothetical protein [Armatimonadota bacterium]
MADIEDVRATKQVRSEFGRKMIDVTQADVRVMHGVAYIRGVVKPIVGGPSDLKQAMHTVAHGLVQKRIIREMIIDCSYRI